MLQRMTTFWLGLACLLMATLGATRFSWAEADSAPQPASPDTQAPAAQAPKPKSPEDELKEQISGTRWTIELTPLSGAEKAKPQKDTVRFEGGQVSSERFAKAGYPQTNYTLSVGGDGVPVWETMQTKEGEGVLFWRGEVHGSTVRGVVSKHPVEGPAEDFSFTGREASGKNVAVGAQAASAALSSQPSAPSAQEPPKKKKRKGRNR
jgi:hypothetical protein